MPLTAQLMGDPPPSLSALGRVEVAPARRLRRTWTDLPGAPQRYLYGRRRGMRSFSRALLVLATALCILAVFL